ncbi:unnamed protein product [Microthlaspi erraticum]|uniref:PIN domain-containing protein n=1 Tax=Microthlaspi erraticum TaxID=1685480 RepID=A0A6D2L598_9BRAS|nr:unnamed protein product [Microthlaspi erraticum]
MASNPSSMWSDIVKKDPPPKPSPSDGAPEAIPAMVGNCKSTKGISTAVVDASAFIKGDQTLTKFADTFVTVPVVYSEISDHVSRSRLALIPLKTREPSSKSFSKVTKFALATGDLSTLSREDIKLIALTYELEVEVNGTKNIRDVPPPIKTVRVKRLPEKKLPGWGSNDANSKEWEALEEETDEKSNSNSKILPLKDLDMNIIPSDKCFEGSSVVSERNHEGKMVVEGVDASQGQFDDDDSGDWTPAVSSSTRRKFLRRKARREHCNALTEQELKQDQEADDKDGNLIVNGSCASEDEVASDTCTAPSVADDGSSEQSLSLVALSESSVACMTGDYAMQNVILLMGLRLLAPEGKQIRQLKRYILRCHGCYTIATPRILKCDGPDIRKMFCPKCGNLGTLRKVEVTVDENGTTVAAPKWRNTFRGDKFSLPTPKGGRDAINKNPVLREDQLPQRFLHPKTKKKASKPGDEFFEAEDVFMNHHSDRKASSVREAMAVFSQKRNPNDNHYSRSRH